MRQGLKELEETALQYQIVSDPMRRCPLEQFQHGIIYEVEGDVVVVHAVAHPKQRPEFWRARHTKL